MNDRIVSPIEQNDGTSQIGSTLTPASTDESLSCVASTHDAIVQAAVLDPPESPRVALRKDILATWTGVDHSMYDALDTIDLIWITLIKELGILAELGKVGAGQKLSALVHRAMENELSYEDIAADFNALVEYGDYWKDLTPPQQEEVDKREIQEEFGHFWRIMGIDSMFAVKTKKIVGELHDVITAVGNLERELGVIRERRINRGSSKPFLPVKKNIEAEGLVHIQSPYMVSTARKTYPFVSAAMSSDSDQEPVDVRGRSALLLFNKLIVRYPLEEAIALLDLVLYKLEGSKDGLQLVAVQQYGQGEKQYAKIISVGNQIVIHTRPEGNFTHTLMGTYSGNNGSIGQAVPTTYSKRELEVLPGDILYMLSSDCSKVIDTMSHVELEALLNEKGSTGRIIPTNNIRRVISGKDSSILTQKCGKREEFVPPEFTDALMSSQLATLVEQMVQDKPLYVAVEGAHVHADRAVSTTQAVGARVAGLLSEMLGKKEAEIFGAPMVDDDHVVNAFDYDHFSGFLRKQGYNFQEIIFESSPLVYELSLDILRFLAAEYPQMLKQVGDNLYLDLGDVMIELIEGLSGEFKTGCVLFDAALCLYKLYPEFLTELYKQHVAQVMPESPFGLVPAHSLMLQMYQSSRRPEDRERAIKQHLPPRTVRLDDIHSGKDTRPFLGAVADKIEQDAAIKDQYIVTILEGTYGNQQRKLEGLMKLLGLIDTDKIVTVMFDQESGEVTFNR